MSKRVSVKKKERNSDYFISLLVVVSVKSYLRNKTETQKPKLVAYFNALEERW